MDKDYDLTIPDYGIKKLVKKGEKGVVQFMAVAEGKFLFYCESCGGADSSAKGYIVVVKK